MKTPRDPGLAAERTSLAWTRSALGLLALAALMLRFARRDSADVLGEIVVAIATLAAAGAGIYAWRERGGAERSLPAVGALRALTLAVFVMAVATTATVLLTLS